MRGVVGGGRPLPFLPTAPQMMNVPARRMNPRLFKIAGVTRDSAGDVLSDCTVDLFESQNPKILRNQMVSGINGAFDFSVTEFITHRLVARKVSGDRFRFYFHVEDTLNGAPAAPTGCATLSEDDPDTASTTAPANFGGHRASAGGTDISIQNKPFTSIGNDEVSGLPPLTAPPTSTQQFGWFTDVLISGTFQAGQWLFRFRELDDGLGITGRPVINMFAATSRNFSSMRFLAQFESTQDWWAGVLNTQSTAADLAAMTLTNEYLFIQLWCHEVDTFLPGSSMNIFQEGSELADELRMILITAPLQAAGQIPVAGATLDTLVGVPA